MQLFKEISDIFVGRNFIFRSSYIIIPAQPALAPGDGIKPVLDEKFCHPIPSDPSIRSE
jgi:hypothetical protein